MSEEENWFESKARKRLIMLLYVFAGLALLGYVAATVGLIGGMVTR